MINGSGMRLFAGETGTESRNRDTRIPGCAGMEYKVKRRMSGTGTKKKIRNADKISIMGKRNKVRKLNKMVGITVFCLGLLLAGCGRGNIDLTEQTEGQTAGSEMANSDETEPAAKSNAESSELSGAPEPTSTERENTSVSSKDIVSDEKIYYGTWIVRSPIATSTVYALTEEEINRMEGSEIIYSKDEYTFQETVCDTPSYQETLLSEEEFERDWKLKLSDLGLKEKEVTAVSVENSDFFGKLIFIKDENTLIIYYDGVYFEAVKS